jgi:hypothetical protein
MWINKITVMPDPRSVRGQALIPYPVNLLDSRFLGNDRNEIINRRGNDAEPLKKLIRMRPALRFLRALRPDISEPP